MYNENSGVNDENIEVDFTNDLVNFAEEDLNVTEYFCELCQFSSKSKRCLNVHIGVKHKSH